MRRCTNKICMEPAEGASAFRRFAFGGGDEGQMRNSLANIIRFIYNKIEVLCIRLQKPVEDFFMKKLLCLILALSVVLLSACSKQEETDSAEATATPAPTVEPTATPVPTIAPTKVPVVAFDDYEYFIQTNKTLEVSFKYPTHWINEPGKSSIRFTEPVNPGETAAQLTVTSKYVEKRPGTDDLVDQMEEFLALVQQQVNEFNAGKADLKKNVDILDTDGVRQKYTARDQKTGEKITGYALMAYSRSTKRIYLLHFTAPTNEYDELSGVIDVIRESMTTF